MASRITYTASVSFEYDEAAPQTFRGLIVAANGPQAARRAYEAARKAFPGSRPRSVVVVLDVSARETVPKRGRYGLPGDVHPVDVAILGGDPSL